MPKIYVRDDVEPSVVYNPHILAHIPIHPGLAFEADDPFVRDHRELFDRGVEQATAAPGERRSKR